jgi:hypothetical protein
MFPPFIIPSPTKLQRDIETLPSVRPSVALVKGQGHMVKFLGKGYATLCVALVLFVSKISMNRQLFL